MSLCSDSREITQRLPDCSLTPTPRADLDYAAVTSVYRATRALLLALRFARHANPLTTVVYTHPSDDEMSARLRGLEC